MATEIHHFTLSSLCLTAAPQSMWVQVFWLHEDAVMEWWEKKPELKLNQPSVENQREILGGRNITSNSLQATNIFLKYIFLQASAGTPLLWTANHSFILIYTMKIKLAGETMNLAWKHSGPPHTKCDMAEGSAWPTCGHHGWISMSPHLSFKYWLNWTFIANNSDTLAATSFKAVWARG